MFNQNRYSMFKHSWFYVFFSAAVLVSGCGDDESAPAFPNAPEARPENDNSGKGVYKGVLIGSSGFVKLNLDNLGNGVISLTLNIDGQNYDLTTEQTYNPEVGFQGYFRGAVGSGEASIGFWTNATGSEYGFFGVEIPGHPGACLILHKEKSNQLVRGFAGTYSGTMSGTPYNGIMNFVIAGNSWTALTRTDGETECSELEGTVDGSTLVCDCDFDGDGTNDINFTGTLSGNTLSGTFSATDVSGTWSASRVF